MVVAIVFRVLVRAVRALVSLGIRVPTGSGMVLVGLVPVVVFVAGLPGSNAGAVLRAPQERKADEQTQG